MTDPARQRPAEDGGYRHVLRLVVPMVLSNAAFTVMQFTDRVLVARFSSEAIQAAMPAGILTFCLLSLFSATAGYAGTFVAQYHGAGDRRATIRSCVAGVWLTVLFLPFFALLLPLFFGLDGVLYSMPVSDILTAVLSALVIAASYRQLSRNGVGA